MLNSNHPKLTISIGLAKAGLHHQKFKKATQDFYIKDEVHFGSVAQREMIKGSNVPRVKDVTKEPPEDL